MKLQIDRKHSFQAMQPTFSSYVHVLQHFRIHEGAGKRFTLIRRKIPALTMDDVQRCTWYMVTN